MLWKQSGFGSQLNVVHFCRYSTHLSHTKYWNAQKCNLGLVINSTCSTFADIQPICVIRRVEILRLTNIEYHIYVTQLNGI